MRVGWEVGFIPGCCFNPASKWHSRASPRNHPEATPWGQGDLGLHQKVLGPGRWGGSEWAAGLPGMLTGAVLEGCVELLSWPAL